MNENLFPATSMPDPDWWHVLWPQPEEIIKALKISSQMLVVDLACGDGYFTSAIAKRLNHGRVIGIDLLPDMLELAKKACIGMSNCEWVLGNAMELSSFVKDPVDFVLFANTFHGVGDKSLLVRQVAKILKPKGNFAIINWYPTPREQTTVLGLARGPQTQLRLSPEQTCAFVEPEGFKLKALIPLPPYHYGLHFKLD